MSVNKAFLIERIRDLHGDSLTAQEAVEAVLETIVRIVAEGDRVAVTGFGAVEAVRMPSHKARNPATGGTMMVPEHLKIRFRSGQSFIELVNGIKPLPEEGSAIKKAPKGSKQPRQ